MALSLAIGIIATLVTALPASAVVPTVTSINANFGAPAQNVQVIGTGFMSGPGEATALTFNGVPSPLFSVNSDTLISAVVPCSTTGLVHVTTPGGTDTNTVTFTYVPPGATTVSSFAPMAGAVGTSVTITGASLCGTTQVLFNGTPATTLVVNPPDFGPTPASVTATVPAGATTGKITVTSPGGTAISAMDFTVGLAPTITSFTPKAGPVGTSVVITGANLAGTAGVKFNGTAATFTENSATGVTATVPTGATTGRITVTNAYATGTSAIDFKVTAFTTHHRSVDLTLKKHLIATGTVEVADGFDACRSHVLVRIQRRDGGHWKTVGIDQTSSAGRYREILVDRAGAYRAVAKKQSVNGGDDLCLNDTSRIAVHRH